MSDPAEGTSKEPMKECYHQCPFCGRLYLHIVPQSTEDEFSRPCDQCKDIHNVVVLPVKPEEEKKEHESPRGIWPRTPRSVKGRG